MNGRTAKKIRRSVYGKDEATRHKLHDNPDGNDYVRISGTVYAPEKRRLYKMLKKEYMERSRQQSR